MLEVVKFIARVFAEDGEEAWGGIKETWAKESGCC